uniref:Uncharacterized protein n=1 Tax=Arundo donax TaxID=35708 RepID=A0A0A9AI28_ARUDO
MPLSMRMTFEVRPTRLVGMKMIKWQGVNPTRRNSANVKHEKRHL